MDKVDPGCRCSHHHIAPVMIVLIGFSFLFQAFGWVRAEIVAVTWPLLLIIAGLAKLTGRQCSCCVRR